MNWEQHFGGMPHYVYECYAADGHALYVGVTARLGARMGQHAMPNSGSSWWSEVASMRVTRYPDKQAGFAAESERIAELKPEHNLEHNPDTYAPGGWVTRRQRQMERHARGELCTRHDGCKDCNAKRRQVVSA